MNKKILVCDVEHDVLKVVVKRLKSWGYQVFIAEDAPQGVHIAHLEKPDLILLDIMLPAGGGEAVRKGLSQSIETELIPIILFTELPEQQLRKIAEEYGAVDYIVKPYDPNILHLKILKIFGDAEQYKVS